MLLFLRAAASRQAFATSSPVAAPPRMTSRAALLDGLARTEALRLQVDRDTGRLSRLSDSQLDRLEL